VALESLNIGKKFEIEQINNLHAASGPLKSFLFAIKSKETKKQYTYKLGIFFKFIGIQGADVESQAARFLHQAQSDHKYAYDCLVNFVIDLKNQVDNNAKTGGTVGNYYYAVKLFYQQNDIEINWDKLERGLPPSSQVANDRSPSLEEIRKVIQYPDRRVKAIVLVMVSSGIRIGAWENLKVKHLTPVYSPQNDKVVIAAKLKVYDGLPNPYYTFVTPEAYQAVQEYLEFRRSYGEQITGESWLMRDKFLTATNNKQRAARKSLATKPKKFQIKGMQSLLGQAFWVQNIRDTLQDGEHRHEFKLSHGFRKYFKSNAERVMRPINVELLMDHKTGISDSYYRPTEQDLLEDYLRAVDYLTIDKNDKMANQLQKQVAELADKQDQRLAEKEKETEDIKKDLERIKARIPAINKNFVSLLMGIMERLKEGEKFELEQPDGSGEKVILRKSYPAYNFGLLDGSDLEADDEELAKQLEEVKKEIFG
jgi:hypothetical protein